MRLGWASALVGVLVVALLFAPLSSAGREVPAATGSPPGATGSSNGTLTVSVTPANAAVTVNGTTVHPGAAGLLNVSLAPGEYLVRATASGDQEFQGNVTILSGQVAYLTIQLVPTAGAAGKSPFWTGYLLPIAITVLAVLGLVGLVFYMRRQGRRPAAAPSAAASAVDPAASDDGPE